MKKLLATLLLGAALAVAALPVAAQGADTMVTVTANGSAAAVSLNLPKDTAQGVKAFQLSFEVKSDDPVEASFSFDKSLPGTVQEYRYDASTGRLNIYVAGRDELLPQGSAELGQVCLTGTAGNATVSVVEDSLQLANGALVKTSVEASSNGEVSLELNNKATPAPQNTAKPSATPTPQNTAKPSATPAPQNTAKPSTTPAPQNTVKPSTTPASGASGTQNDSVRDTAATASPTLSAAPVLTPSAGQSNVVSGGSGSKKPSAGSNASSDSDKVLSTETTPEPEAVVQATATPKPSATSENAMDAAGEKTSSALTLVPILAIAVLAVVVVVVVLRRRR